MADVELRGIAKRYGAVQAVAALDLRVEPGQFVSLLGPSGCGKTTTLRIIAGLVRPDAGQVIIGGRVMNDVPVHHRGLGLVAQNYALFPHMTVMENVTFGLRMRRAAPADIARRAGEALEMVRLTGLGDRYPRQLSGGQQQRVALARCLLVEPAVLLLDEPLGALDKKLREAMQVELKSLQRQVGITAIFVTHDQEEALTLS
ncbi:MAG: polyamine ABC transporter ATP-binding protein, partial [Candidatus Rokuibacteriota bacterium]